MSGFIPAALHAALIMQPVRAADVERHMGASRLNVNEDRRVNLFGRFRRTYSPISSFHKSGFSAMNRPISAIESAC